jgi:predicted ATPase
VKITQLEIEGFRSLKRVNWKPSDLNVVIGPNGTGKSNLLSFLELVAVAAQGGLGKYVQSLGGMEPLVWDGQASNISFTIKTLPVDYETNPLYRGYRKPDRAGGPEHYELTMARLGSGSSYRIYHELLANYAKVLTGEKPNPFKFLERNDQSAVVFDDMEHAFVAPPETISEEETLLSLAAGPFTNNRHIPLFQKELASVTVYHDLRVDRYADIRTPAVARAEKTVDSDGRNLVSVLHTLYTGDRDFKKNINLAMSVAFGDDFEELVFTPDAYQRIQLRIRWKTLRRDSSAVDVSDGTLRFLLLLTILASPVPASVIAIDEPETGLHPSMLPIVAEYAVEASTRSQVIFTTHSPQFLDSFSDTVPTATIAKWSGGETTLEVISGTDLNYWLKEYTLGALYKSGELEAMT